MDQQITPLSQAEMEELGNSIFVGRNIEGLKQDLEIQKSAIKDIATASPEYPKALATIEAAERYIELLTRYRLSTKYNLGRTEARRKKKRNFAMIVAATKDGEIGYKNTIPWKLKSDMARFKQITLGHVVIMGSTTFESIGRKPLPGRVNIVVTSKAVQYRETRNVVKDLYYASSIEDALALAESYLGCDVFFIGGVKIYEYALKMVDQVYLTLVHQPGVYDTKIEAFQLPPSTWVLNENMYTEYTHDPETGIPTTSHTYLEYSRKSPISN